MSEESQSTSDGGFSDHAESADDAESTADTESPDIADTPDNTESTDNRDSTANAETPETVDFPDIADSPSTATTQAVSPHPTPSSIHLPKPAPTMSQAASTPAPTPPSNIQTQQQGPASTTATATQPIDLLPADMFDFTAPLHELLSRLLTQPPAVQGGAGAASACFPGQAPLDIQQLVSEVSDIKGRIRRARAAVEGLPDVGRTVDEQEAEMAELRERIARQREMLGRLKKR